ncbi:MAG TPA: NYN domain-containing protein [Thermoanaerobaculia bacterium]|nr:NYN domain-containing protein [Thermoanaerobaculia bacterium]
MSEEPAEPEPRMEWPAEPEPREWSALPEPRAEWSEPETVSPPPAPVFEEPAVFGEPAAFEEPEMEMAFGRSLTYTEAQAEEADEADLDADEEAGEDLEVEAEASEETAGMTAEEKEEKAESRRKRSRRRGGRRKNGKAASSTAEAADEDEDEEPAREEPAYEEPAPAPRRVAQSAPRAAQAPAPPRALAPVPAARSVRESRESRDSYVIPGDFDTMSPREIIISVPDRQRADHERKIALFCDFENIALGVRDSDIGKFEITLILERLLEKGKIIVKKAYADWERYSDYKRPFHEAAIELIDIPQKFYSGKNSADIKMVVDAMDLSYSKEHLDTFVILSGDSDFSPLVSKLKENNKYVIGIGVKNSSSNLLVDNCDEFIYYEDVWRDSQKGPKLDGLNKKTAEAFSLMIESIQALIRENKDVLWGSMIKQTMQRKKPSFNEGYYGYSTFSELLEDAERKNILKLKKDQRSGTYIVTGFAKTGDGSTSVGRR